MVSFMYVFDLSFTCFPASHLYTLICLQPRQAEEGCHRTLGYWDHTGWIQALFQCLKSHLTLKLGGSGILLSFLATRRSQHPLLHVQLPPCLCVCWTTWASRLASHDAPCPRERGNGPGWSRSCPFSVAAQPFREGLQLVLKLIAMRMMMTVTTTMMNGVLPHMEKERPGSSCTHSTSCSPQRSRRKLQPPQHIPPSLNQSTSHLCSSVNLLLPISTSRAVFPTTWHSQTEPTWPRWTSRPSRRCCSRGRRGLSSIPERQESSSSSRSSSPEPPIHTQTWST